MEILRTVMRTINKNTAANNPIQMGAAMENRNCANCAIWIQTNAAALGPKTRCGIAFAKTDAVFSIADNDFTSLGGLFHD